MTVLQHYIVTVSHCIIIHEVLDLLYRYQHITLQKELLIFIQNVHSFQKSQHQIVHICIFYYKDEQRYFVIVLS